MPQSYCIIGLSMEDRMFESNDRIIYIESVDWAVVWKTHHGGWTILPENKQNRKVILHWSPKKWSWVSFNGTGNVVEFVKKMDLLPTLKAYDGEKLAQNLASRSSGSAFDVYLRLSDEDQKDVEKMKTDLLK